MKKITKLLLTAIVLLTAHTATHGAKREKETKFVESKQTITHPSTLFNAEDFERVRQHIAEADDNDLVYASFKYFSQKSKYTNLNHKINPQEYFSRSKMVDGRDQNFLIAARDASHAIQCAMMWRLLSASDPTKAKAYADKAVLTLNAWATTCIEGGGRISDRFLGFGYQGYQFGVAGDLLQGYEGWSAEDIKRYNTWLKKIFYSNNKVFLKGTWRTNCDFHYWTNWPLANMASALAIGICTEDQDIINFALKQFYSGHHNGGLKYMVHGEGFADPDSKSKSLLAQCQESGRDQGHTMIDVVLGAEFCQMAYNQGIDLFGHEDNRILQMFEYCAKYNARRIDYPKVWVSDFKDFSPRDWLMDGSKMPFTEYTYCPHDCECTGKCGPKELTKVSETGRGGLRSSWHLIYNHYVKVKGMDEAYCYYSKIAAEQTIYSKEGELVGDPGAGDAIRRGDNSSAFDQIGWSSMMFTR
ncbi:MAG: alginate lyase family protein [Rikenellaceae bacterium]